ncbi:MAG TPA: hypothetical protein VF624_09670 [Tepidisphaeraceae bacterium]
MSNATRFCIATAALSVTAAAFGQLKAFPQAEGFGAVSTGGRGGDVYHVTNLNDSGTGSLRSGIDNAPAAGRTIVFDVAGWINLTSKLGVTKSKITIAGQTAPGGGIGVRGNQFSVGGDHVTVRHMRFRPGKGAGRVDSVNTNGDARWVIYDHVSAGYSYDENFSAQAQDMTLQYSTVSYGLETHSAGSLLEQPHRLSFHHNLYAHNNTRNPKARVNDQFDFVDNVIYDYNNGFIAGDSTSGGYAWRNNVDGNYFITGPGDTGRNMITLGNSVNTHLWFGTNGYDNDGDKNHDGSNRVGNGVDGTGLPVSGSYQWSAVPFVAANTTVARQALLLRDASPQAAYLRTLAEFGATPWKRDEIDTLLYNNVVTRSGAIVSHENQLGLTNGGFGTLAAGTKLADTDNDGMPDAWETKHGTSPTVANNNADFDTDGFTDLEEYLNDIAAFKALTDIVHDGSGRYADSANWTNRWEPSRVDSVNLNTGTANVDARGQKAGTLRVGALGGSSATLAVQSGWLEITDELQVGAGGTGTVTQSGGEVRVLNGGVMINNGTYTLAGGTLVTPNLAKNAAGTFNLTGGTLSADMVYFPITNKGALIDPGDLTNVLAVTGDFIQQSGTLQVELGGSQTETLRISGAATLGGTLDLRHFAGLTATAGQLYLVLDAATLTGTFANVLLPDNRNWSVVYRPATGDVLVGVNVPEPTTTALLLLAPLAMRRRRTT